MEKFKAGDKVYWILDYADEPPKIMEGVVGEQKKDWFAKRLVTVVDPVDSDARMLWQFIKPEELTHTIAGAHVLLSIAINERIRKLREQIDVLQNMPR